jgi:hypothetical protein
LFNKNKEIKELEKAIRLHEQALEDLGAKQEAANTALENFKRREIAGLRPGQMAVFLGPDPLRERLQQEVTAATVEYNRIENKLSIMRRILKDNLAHATA